MFSRMNMVVVRRQGGIGRGLGRGDGVMKHVFFLFLGMNGPAIFLRVRFDCRVMLFVTTAEANPGPGVGGQGSGRSLVVDWFLSGPLVECYITKLGEKQDRIVHQGFVGENRIGETAPFLRESRSDDTANRRSFLNIGDGIKGCHTRFDLI